MATSTLRLLLTLGVLGATSGGAAALVHSLTSADVRKVPESIYEGLEIFCHPAQNISVFKLW